VNKWIGARRDWRLVAVGGTLAIVLLVQLLSGPGFVRAATANNDTAATNEDTALIISVLTNDTGSGLKVGSVGAPAHGTATIVDESAGTISYSPSANWNGTDSFSYTITEGSTLLNPDNGHYYEFVSAPGQTWFQARDGAASRTLFGRQGYLVTITSAEEQTFVQTKLVGKGWMGASDAALEGTWRWVTGPENGQGLTYTNWDANEPNNSSGDEDYAHFYTTGLWNDFNENNSATDGYVVEYGDMAGDMPTAPPTATVTVTVNPRNDAPVNTAAPQATGTPHPGRTLATTNGTWDDSIDSLTTVFTFTYRWQSSINGGLTWLNVFGATNQTYTVVAGDIGKTLHCVVTCLDESSGIQPNQSAMAISNPMTVTNQAPVITEGTSTSVTMSEDGSLTAFSLTLHATDVDLDTITWSILTAATNGTATASGTGLSMAIGYAPTANYNGADSFVVRVSDGLGGTDDITVNVTVTAVNDVPSFTKGADESVFEDTGLHTVASWATAMSAGPADESAQILDFIVTNDTNALFSIQPAVAPDGTLTYTLAADANGLATVSVQIHDSGGTADGGVNTSAIQTFTITVTGISDVPSFTKGVDQTIQEDWGAQMVAGWASNISAGPANESGQAVDFIVTNGNNPLFSAQPAISPTGTLTYTPAPDQNGWATVTVQIHDDGGTANGGVDTSAAQTFTIHVWEVNDSPIITNDAFPFAEDDTLILSAAQLLSNDSPGPANESGQTLWVGTVVNPVHCTVNMAGTVITVVPTADYNGTASFEYSIYDNGTSVGSPQPLSDFGGVVTLTITPVVDIVADAVTTLEDTPITFNAITGTNGATADSFENPLRYISAVTQGTYGAVTFLPDGSITYTPVADWNGIDSFTYTVTSPPSTIPAVTETATVSVTVTPVVDIVADAVTTLEDTPITFNAVTGTNGATADTFENSGWILTAVTQGAHGNVNFLADGRIGYTPVADWNGTDTFTYTVTSPPVSTPAVTETATVTMTVTPVVDIVADAVTTLEDTPITFNAITGTNGASADNFENPLRYISAVTQGTHSVTVTFLADGSITYTPVADWNGTDTFTYTVTSPPSTTPAVTETATVTVTVTPVVDIVADAVTTLEDMPITFNAVTGTNGATADTFENPGWALTAVTQGTHGGVTFLANGSITYTNVPDWHGIDSFTYTVTSPPSTTPAVTETATVTVTVTPVVDITDDVATTPEDTAVVISVLANDTFEGFPVVTSTSAPAHGTAVINAGTTVTYNPVADWNGIDSFTYTVTSPAGITEWATVTVTVTPVNDPPVNTIPPVISGIPALTGSPYVGQTLTTTTGTWNDHIDTDVSGISTLSYTYQWLRARDAAGTGLVLIPDATISTYIVAPSDEGMYVAVRVTCTDDGVGLPLHQSASADSAFLAVPSRRDMISPTITLPDFSSWPGVTGWSRGTAQTFTVGTSPFPLQFTLEDSSGSAKWTIKVNGIVIVDPVGSGLITYPVPLSEGRNDIEISASDASGNTTSVKLVIYLDTMGPVLTVEPALPASVTTPRLTIAGSVVDATSGLKLVTINGTAVIPFLDGSFRETLTLTRGVNTITIEAEDKAGHTASATYTVTYATVLPPLPSAKTITLTIGKTAMDVNGMTVALDTAPVIKESRTMLPIRAIAEAINASVAWDPVARKVTITRGSTRIELWIGKSIAKLNGKSISIDAANSNVVPYITNGRTLLPVRFIAEMLGLDVQWNALTQVVTLTLQP
jgi:hypothetical protein